MDRRPCLSRLIQKPQSFISKLSQVLLLLLPAARAELCVSLDPVALISTSEGEEGGREEERGTRDDGERERGKSVAKSQSISPLIPRLAFLFPFFAGFPLSLTLPFTFFLSHSHSHTVCLCSRLRHFFASFFPRFHAPLLLPRLLLSLSLLRWKEKAKSGILSRLYSL